MDNEKIFKSLKFEKGDGTLHYHIHNLNIPCVQNEKNGLILF